MSNNINQVFSQKKPIIGMLHLDYLFGSVNFKGMNSLIDSAKRDALSLQGGGIDGILIENWKEDSLGEFVTLETAMNFCVITRELAKIIKIPFGVNVLNNDYKVALITAKLTGASFIQMDVFVDHVISDYKYGPIASLNSFEIDPKPKNIHDYAKSIGAENIPIVVFIQPKHYKLIDKGKLIEQSAKEAVDSGASAILVTKSTGNSPSIELITRAKSVSDGIYVGIGSGFNISNASDFLPHIDFATVGSGIKFDNNVDNPVDAQKVRELMNLVKKFR